MSPWAEAQKPADGSVAGAIGARNASTEANPNAIDRQYAAFSPDLPRRIHILGVGSIGKLVAHSLRGLADPPPVTLMLHRYSWLEKWEKGKKAITIRDNDVETSNTGFDVEVLPENFRAHGVEKQTVGDPFEFPGVQPHAAAEVLKRDAQERRDAGEEIKFEPELVQVAHNQLWPRTQSHGISTDPIHNLIITTKAALTVPALLPIRHRITAQTTICFLQNGMGIIEEVNKEVFPDLNDRPHYVQGVVSHGVNVPPEVAQRDPFFAVHAGHGTIALGVVPREGYGKALPESGTNETPETQNSEIADSARYLIRTLAATPVLAAVAFTPMELLQLQLEKLAVNSVLNPLTALIDARNGNILHNFALTRTMRLLLAETSQIIRDLPELRAIPNLELRFGAERLEKLVVSVAAKTAENISSMLADVRAGRKTEIEFINGYIVGRGEEMGVKAVVNYAIMQTVIGKAQITQREVQEEVPMEGESPKRWA